MLRYSLITLIVLCHFSSNLNATEFVGISDKDFQIHYRAQQGKFLCWATCAEMVLAHQGIKLPADAIVKKNQRIQDGFDRQLCRHAQID